MDDEAILTLLQSIDRRLALLTLTQQKDIQQRLNKEVLRTDARLAIYQAINGNRTSPDIAKMTGASERAVQMVVKELLDAGLVRQTGKAGRGPLVERDESGVIKWYLDRLSAD
jgi:predicted HTH transcriptional regulator